MTGLPSQTSAQALADVTQAIDLAPEHLSLSQLTLEPNTPFFSRPPADLPDDDAADDIQLAVHEAVQAAGYAQYEVSAWARSPSSRSRHNLNYWQFGDYLAIGAGAHGKITQTDGTVLRYHQHKSPKGYIHALQDSSGLAHLQQQSIAEADLPFEFLLNALRLKDGVDSALFTHRTGLPLSALAEDWTVLAADGLLLPLAERLVTSEYGYRHLNAVLARWL
jgi:oxygen-independent coproporphyrinogen-3 oxidase